MTAASHMLLMYKFQALWLGNEFSILIPLPLLTHQRFWKNHKSRTDSEHRSFPACYQITLGILWKLRDSSKTSCPWKRAVLAQKLALINGQKTPRPLQNTEVHCRTQNSTLLLSILRQINIFRKLPCFSSYTHFNIVSSISSFNTLRAGDADLRF